jgi:hypothetical protein
MSSGVKITKPGDPCYARDCASVVCRTSTTISKEYATEADAIQERLGADILHRYDFDERFSVNEYYTCPSKPTVTGWNDCGPVLSHFIDHLNTMGGGIFQSLSVLTLEGINPLLAGLAILHAAGVTINNISASTILVDPHGTLRFSELMHVKEHSTEKDKKHDIDSLCAGLESALSSFHPRDPAATDKKSRLLLFFGNRGHRKPLREWPLALLEIIEEHIPRKNTRSKRRASRSGSFSSTSKSRSDTFYTDPYQASIQDNHELFLQYRKFYDDYLFAVRQHDEDPMPAREFENKWKKRHKSAKRFFEKHGHFTARVEAAVDDFYNKGMRDSVPNVSNLITILYSLAEKQPEAGDNEYTRVLDVKYNGTSRFHRDATPLLPAYKILQKPVPEHAQAFFPAHLSGLRDGPYFRKKYETIAMGELDEYVLVHFTTQSALKNILHTGILVSERRVDKTRWKMAGETQYPGIYFRLYSKGLLRRKKGSLDWRYAIALSTSILNDFGWHLLSFDNGGIPLYDHRSRFMASPITYTMAGSHKDQLSILNYYDRNDAELMIHADKINIRKYLVTEFEYLWN